jgi:uncharacterized protein (UPF0332 family)
MPASHHDQLLALAKILLTLDPRKPRQANLKRALSTAYYALFHLLVHDGVDYLVRKAPFRSFLARAFSHSDMLNAAQVFRSSLVDLALAKVHKAPPKAQGKQHGSLKPPLPTVLAIEPAVNQVAETFVLLQETRHQADYDVSRRFSRKEAESLVAQTEAAFVTTGINAEFALPEG